MRVVMTTDSVGGVWDLSLTLAAGLQAVGHEVTLAHVGPGPRETQQEEAAATGVALVARPFPLEWMPRGLDQADGCRRWLDQVARDADADVVHCNSYSHVDPAARTPQVLAAHSSLHGWWDAVHPDLDAPSEWEPYRAAVAQALETTDAVVAPSTAMLAELGRSYGRSEGRVIHNGLPAPAAMAGGRQELVLTGGRLWDAGKGHDVLDAAAARLRWPVVATGSTRGPEAAIRFQHMQPLGFLPRQRLEELYRSAAVYVNPARYEPFGLSALEAAMRGCPLVLSDLPSQREVWGPAARYAPPGDVQALADAITDLMEDPATRQDMAQNARRRALRFDVDTMVRQYEQLYEDLLVVLA